MAYPLATAASVAAMYWIVPFLDVAMAILAFALAINAKRLYDMCETCYHKYFYYAFVFITLGLLGAAASEFHVLHETLAGEESFHAAIFCACSEQVENLGMMCYNIFTLIGYLLLAYTFYIKDNRKATEKCAPLALIPMWFENSVSFHFLFVLLLAYVAYYQWKNYDEKKTPAAMTTAAFVSLLMTYHMAMIASATVPFFFALAYAAQLTAFLMLLVLLRGMVFTKTCSFDKTGTRARKNRGKR